MSILALIACLLAQHAWPVKGAQPLLAFYGRMCLSASKRLNAGDRNSGILAWTVLMGALLVPAALLTALAAAIHPVASWALNVAVLYGTLRFFSTTGSLAAIERTLRTGDTAAAARHLGLWRAEPVETDDATAIARTAAEHGLREGHQGTFAPLFWFLLLPGPLGLVLYPLALRAARSWEHPAEPGEHDFGWFAARAFRVIDWLPQRASAFAFAIAGNFEDALYCWRSQPATAWSVEEAVALASGAGALGVRLGEIGAGEAPREDAIASLEGLLWRVLAVWAVVYLLAAAVG